LSGVCGAVSRNGQIRMQNVDQEALLVKTYHGRGQLG
jgi:hypothetical protein